MEWKEEIVDGDLYLVWGFYVIRINQIKRSYNLYYKNRYKFTFYDLESAKRVCEIMNQSIVSYNERENGNKKDANSKPNKSYVLKIKEKHTDFVSDKKAQELARMQFENDLRKFNAVGIDNE